MFLFAKIDYHKLIDFAPWLYGFFLLALMAVLVPGIGHKALGARRWIKVGPMQFQPSEWMKLVIILMVARYFANLGGRSLTWKDIFKAFAHGWHAHAADPQATGHGHLPDVYSGAGRSGCSWGEST